MAVVVAVVAHIMHACMHTLCRNSHSRIWPNPRVQSPVSSVQCPIPESTVQGPAHDALSALALAIRIMAVPGFVPRKPLCRPMHLPYALWQCRVSYLTPPVGPRWLFLFVPSFDCNTLQRIGSPTPCVNRVKGKYTAMFNVCSSTSHVKHAMLPNTAVTNKRNNHD